MDVNRKAGMRKCLRGFTVSCLSVCLIIVWGGLSRSSAGQLGHEFFSPMDEYADYANTDYFQKDGKGEVQALLGNVETHHFSRKNFWPAFRGGVTSNYGLGDLRYVLWVFPNHPRALMVLTLIAQVTDNPNLPIAYFQKAIHLFPQHAFTHAQFGAYLKDIGRWSEAIKELKLATKIDPSMGLGYAWLAEAYFKNEQTDLGKEAAQKARELGYEKEIVGEKADK